MSIEKWTVRGPGGFEVGQIKKLVIDSETHQITYADVLLFQGGKTEIFPWSQFEVTADAIVLHAPTMQSGVSETPPDRGALDAPPLVTVHTPVLGKVKPYPRRRVS